MMFKIMTVVSAILIAAWVLIIAWLFYLGFTTSFISDEFFKWEGISIGVFVASGVSLLITDIFIE